MKKLFEQLPRKNDFMKFLPQKVFLKLIATELNSNSIFLAFDKN